MSTHPCSTIHPQKADLDENGLTAQDREDLRVLQNTYDRMTERWRTLSPRSRNRRLLSLVAHGSVALSGILQISVATEPRDPEGG